MQKIKMNRLIMLIIIVIIMLVGGWYILKEKSVKEITQEVQSKEIKTDENLQPQENSFQTTIKISASGDLLYHIGLIRSAKVNDKYDFSENYTEIKPLISSMDLAIGNYEGSMHPDYQLNGYPLFNAPINLPKFIADAGYDVMSLANNHILDSNIEGLISTYNLFNQAGITPFGVTVNKGDSRVLIKEVNGIKLAILGYSYGFNGMEANVAEDEKFMLHTLDEEKIKKDLMEAESKADITIVFPHLGDEYHLQPNEYQEVLYDKMIEWGADIIYGNHAHVVQPAKLVSKDKENKYIIYSMGNLISNQRIETMDDTMNKEWTERGVIIETHISKKEKEKAKLNDIIYHPTWVRKTLKGSINGIPTFTYTTLLTENYLNDQKNLTDDEWKRVKETHYAILEHLKIKGGY